MKFLFVFSLIFFTGASLPVSAAHYESAHAIVLSNYGFHPNGQLKQYVLFGLTKSGKLSTFGGLRDRGERDPKSTVAREVAEEALDVLGDRRTIRKQLRGIQAVSGVDRGNPCYVVPARYYGDRIARKFRKIRFKKGSSLSRSQKEMVDIVTVRVEKVRRQVNSGGWIQFVDNQGNVCPLRGGVAGVLKTAVHKGFI